MKFENSCCNSSFHTGWWIRFQAVTHDANGGRPKKRDGLVTVPISHKVHLARQSAQSH